jgi:hypothetical protein
MESLCEAMVANEQDAEWPGAGKLARSCDYGGSECRRDDYTLSYWHAATNKALQAVFGMDNDTIGRLPLLFDPIHVSRERHRSDWLDLRMGLLF